MKLKFDHDPSLQWFKEPLFNQFALKESKRSARTFAALRLKGFYPNSVRGLGTYNGKNVELKLINDGLYFNISVKFADDGVEWGQLRSHPWLHDEPATLRLNDGRVYFLKKIEWDKFRLYTADDRTVAITTYQSTTVFRIVFKIMDVIEADSDYPMLALVSLMAIVLWNHQTG